MIIMSLPTSTSIKILMADRFIKKPIGVLFDVMAKVDKFILPANFMVLDCEIDQDVTIIIY